MAERTPIQFVRGVVANIGTVVTANGKPFWATDTQVLYICQSGVWYPINSGGGGSPGGSDTQVQFNNSGSFGGAANVRYESGYLIQKDKLSATLSELDPEEVAEGWEYANP